jgi:DNA-binding NarL/FixJ family response regulator
MSKEAEKKSILVVEDHPIVREGIVALLNRQPDLRVVGEAWTHEDAKRMTEGLQPDLVLLDLMLDGTDGLECIRDLRARRIGCKILVLSMHSEEVFAQRALKAGATGYVMKQEATETILTAIEKILQGEIYISQKVSISVFNQFVQDPRRSGRDIDCLTDRELHIFQAIGMGQSTRQISDRLGVSIKTVESHRENIKHKLGLENSVVLVREATLWAQKHCR